MKAINEKAKENFYSLCLQFISLVYKFDTIKLKENNKVKFNY